MHCCSSSTIRHLVAWLSCLAITTGASLATPQAAVAQPSDQLVKALSYKPRQAAVKFEEIPRDQFGECSIEETTREGEKGFLVTGPNGQPLRWFADTNGDNKLDKWSYYHAGVEVYRELDTNFNGTADQYRWLNTEGLRRGDDKNEDGQIDAWSMISAEEVTAEVVRAAAKRDVAQFRRLLITNDEIAALKLGAQKAELVKQRVRDASEQFESWCAGQNVVTAKSSWTNFGADKPGVVPAGTDGSEKDVVVYENVVALLDDEAVTRQLLVGTLIQVGNTWRLVDLPRAVSEGAVVSDAGVFFSASFSPRGANGSDAAADQGGISKAMERLVTELQEIDSQMQSGTSKPEVLQAQRANVLEKLISASTTPEDRQTWVKQFAETVSAAAQTGEYPGGVARLREFSSKLASVDASEEEMAYVVYRTLEAEYRTEMLNAKADDFEKVQTDYLKNMEAFVRKYPDSEDAAEAMIQMALSAEFSGEVETAKQWYQKAASGFASTLAGRKAAGALKRLGMEGKMFGLKSPTLDGRTFSSEAYLGGPVVYHCWASWCEGCKAEMRALKELQAKYAKTKLRIVGINFDNDPQPATAFLKQNPFPWVHLYDQGGLDSNLAVSYGILTLPLNVVVDGTGKVVKTGVHWTELDGVLEELVK